MYVYASTYATVLYFFAIKDSCIDRVTGVSSSYWRNISLAICTQIDCSLAPIYLSILLARDVIYTSRAYAMMPVRLSVRLSVTEVHWRIIANLGFKFRSHFTAHCGRRAAGGRRAARRAACGRIISRQASQC